MYRICSPCTPGCHKRMQRAFNGGYYFPLFTCPLFWKEKAALYERNHRTMNNEEKILGILMQMQSDIAGLKAGQAALEDTAYFEKPRAAIMDTRAWTMQQLTDRGFTVLDSRANFVFASTGRINGGELYKELKKNGILVRHFDAPRIENWLRITIGTPEQMQALMDAVDKILEV